MICLKYVPLQAYIYIYNCIIIVYNTDIYIQNICVLNIYKMSSIVKSKSPMTEVIRISGDRSVVCLYACDGIAKGRVLVPI